MAFASPCGEKTFWRGTHRTRAPGETFARAQDVAERLGITRIANITGLDRLGVPVVSVVRPNARSISVAQGKGLDLDSAKASGLMEAIEGHHAESIGLPLRHQSSRQMAEASLETADLTRLPRVQSTPIHPDRRMFWIEAHALFDAASVWLPYELVHTDFTDEAINRPSFFMSSNGLASGNHHAEAWNHALYELIERDSATLWELSRSAAAEDDPTRVDLSTIDDNDCLDVLARYARARMIVVVNDTTSDVGVPCFRCTIGEQTGSSLHGRPPSTGYGCHADRSIALLRALLEAAQSRLTFIAGVRDDIPMRAYDSIAVGETSRSFAARARNAGTKSFAAVPSHSDDSFAGDLSWLRERLAAVGCSQIVGIDLSKPEIGIPVVRVVVPGLEAMCSVPGYVPGARARGILANRDQVTP
jgi:YcaO-like protein with predicted kinase domain